MTFTRISPKKAVAAEHKSKEKNYWLEKLAGFDEPVGFPYDFHQPPAALQPTAAYTHPLAPDLFALLVKVSNGSEARLHMVLLTGLGMLLHKMTGKPAFIISTPVYKQNHETERINTVLPIAVRVDPAASYKELLLQVRQTLVEATEHQGYPVQLLPDLLQILPNGAGFPLFEVGLLLENIQDYPDLAAVPHTAIFSFAKTDTDVSLTVHYAPERYEAATIRRTVDLLESALRTALTHVDLPLSDITLLTEPEKHQVLHQFNQTRTEYPKAETLVALFEAQAEQTPEALALVYGELTYTYRQLNTRANQLAHYIREKYAPKPGELIGLLVERSDKAIISLLGILKAGGAYLPIDPEWPEARIRLVLEDTGVTCLLQSSAHQTAAMPTAARQRVVLEEAWHEMTRQPAQNPHPAGAASDLAYVMYTSGSTGTPKGVMVEHRNIVRLVKNTNYLTITPQDRMLQAAPLSFDAATFEIWGALLNGASLHVAPKETVLDPAQLEIFLQKNPVTVGWLTASLFNNLVNQQPQLFSAMRALLVGGEALSPGHIRKARQHNQGLTLINGYGPTENTTFSACFRIEKDHADAIPIGSPVANSQCYVLSDTLAVQPIGVPGELYVAGDGVARGYWNQDALTREKFRENPFVPGGRMYKTGDLAKWLPDGNLAFLGRKDDQVKIRGYRIEPQEIRQALLGLDGIREAVIVVREDPGAGQPYLCAYLVSDSAPDAGQLGAALGKSLPAYMVPAHFVAVDKIPLTANGKVNQQALPAPQITRGASGLPKNAVEEKLVRIWADVLGLEKEQIGTHASFFALGGHSLKAARMLSQIHRELEVKLSLKDTFALTTIAQLADAIEARQPEKYQSIPKADEKRFYPLSSTQKRLYVLQQMEVDTVSYNLPSVAILEGNLDQDRLEATFKQLIERHESLRTSFELILGQPLQKIHKAVHFAIERYDAGTAQERPEDIIKDFVRPFLLNKAPLLRVGLKPIAADKHYLMVDMHHIISDGVSEDIFRREFMALYGGETVAPLRLQYKDFSEWKNQSAQKEATRGQEEYWLREFAGEVPVLQLPTDYPRPAVQSFEGEAAHFHLPEAAAQAVRELALREGTTPYNVLLAVFNVLLGKLSGQDDVVVGTPVAGRRHAELDAIIGVFVNTLVLRNYPQGDKTFRAFLAEVNRRTLEAFDHQDYPFEDLVEKVAVSRDTSRNPLFSVMFNYHNIGTVAVAIPGLRLLPFEAEQKVSKFDLSLDVLDLDGALSFAFEYSTRLFKAETIGRIIHYFTSIVSTVLARPDATLGSVEIITEAEKQQVLYGFNRKTIAYPKDQTVQALLEAQVARSPESVAVEFEGEPLTYAALNHKANGLARRLREQSVKPGTVVGVMIDRSLDLPVALAAILKAGGAYLPIDPAYPEARQQYMLADSQVDVLLTQKQFLETHPSLRSANDARQIICVDEEASYAGEGGNPQNPNQPGDLLYVVYTSGTTGDAKGIMVEHRNLLAYLAAFNEIFAQTADDVTLQITSVSFDIFAEQFWGTLLKGGKIIIPKEEAVKDAEKLSRLIRRHKVTLVSCPPLILNELNKLKPLSSVRAFINGGDVLKPAYVSALHTYAKVYNGYGPAETTIGATHYLYEGEAVTTIPIGPPMSNYRIYILDGNEKPLPVGVPGELCISGDAVSRGYIGKPELTAQKFVANPFVPGERMYKTGDLAKWLPDGNLAFVGRVDQQVKIRGYRIEPGEIESHLRKHEAIDEALVVAREDKKEKYLCAYYQAGSALEVAALRAFLLQSLPDYMVPAYFVRITRIPMTPNGKVNVKELPVPTLKAAADFVAPRNEMEARLVAIWAAVLEAEKDNISVETDFFAVGGNSINATQLIAKIQKEFSITMPLVEAFKAPNISLQAVFIGSELAKKQAEKATLAEQLRDNGEFAADILHAGALADGNQAASSGAPADEIPVEAVPRQPHYPLSSGQRRMYILNQLDKEATNYNMFGAFEINGQLDRDRLEGVIAQLFRRHESLRTHFEMIDGEMVQVVSEKAEVAVEYFDQVEESQVQAIVRDFVRPFDLGRAPLFRVGLITLRAERYVLLLDTHHIVTDGVSMQILIEEFVRLSGGEELPALPYQYKDYTHWQQKRMESAAFGAHERYWLERLGGDLPVLHLPTDYRRPLVQRFAGDLVSFELDAETTTRLRTLGNETGTTVYMILLAAYQVLFHKYTGQSDILIGSPVAVRPVNDFARILGMFANTVVMRGYPEGRKKFSTFLDEVKTATVEAVTHQEYPFEELIELLHIKRDLSRNPVFDVMFASQNTGKNREIQLQKLQVKPYPFPTTTSMFDLLLNAVETETHIDFTVIFNTSLFKRETVSRFCAHYLRILEQVAANKDALIGEIDLLTEPERKRMLETFNQTAAAFPVQQTLVSLLQAQAAQTPERTAVLFEDRSLTYRELDAAAHALARYLREEYAVQPGELVGILMDRSEWMVIGLLGILKAGAAYVPIDPTYPEERVRYLLTDAAVRVMLTDEATRQKGSPVPGTEAVVVAGQWPRILAGANGTLAPDLARPEHTAYLIYTSGSTGAPKGVEITHRNAVAFLSWAQGAFAASDFELVLAGTSYCFDLSVFEIFFTLSVGKTLRVLKSNLEIGQYLDPARKILVNTVPSVVEGLLKEKVDLSPVTVLNMAGEPVPFYFKDLIDHQTREVRNLYGPSEDTTYSTCYRFSAAHDLIPAGKPIANTRVYIVDEALRLLPEGLVGEICLAGEGLAKGYRNKPALTDQAFVANPFEPGQRMYRTGDLGRWLPDGNLEFMGRKDYQVKIRGYRIELGEIENALQAHAHIQQAVVVAQTGADGEKYLAAYYVSTGALSPAQVKRDLQRRLPDYLIPAHLVPLAALPLTPNGKIDRKALPSPESLVTAATIERVEARDELERKLAGLWREVVGGEKIGIRDNFFEMGGHSLKAARLVTLISKELQARISLKDIFTNPTIESLAGIIRGLEPGRYGFIGDAPTAHAAGEPPAIVRHQSPGSPAAADSAATKIPEALTIIAFPYAGGNQYSFAPWKQYLPADVKLVTLEAPGREHPEELLTDLNRIVDALFAQVKSHIRTPYVFFGHSMGSLVSYLVTKRILAENLTPPVHLFVSGRPGPQVSPSGTPVHQLSSEAFMQELKQFRVIPPELYGDQNSLRYIEQLLRADYAAIEQYRYTPSAPFAVPVTVFYGKREGLSERMLRESWQRETTRPVTVQAFAGDHFFLFDHWQKMSEMMVATVQKK